VGKKKREVGGEDSDRDMYYVYTFIFIIFNRHTMG
jgi:hypothetical protein